MGATDAASAAPQSSSLHLLSFALSAGTCQSNCVSRKIASPMSALIVDGGFTLGENLMRISSMATFLFFNSTSKTDRVPCVERVDEKNSATGKEFGLLPM